MSAAGASFGPFALSGGTLLRDGKPVALGQRALALLEALAAADGPVDKATLIEAAWPGTIVEEGNLTVQIAALRKALGSRADGQEWIVTVPRMGYRLLRDQRSVAVAPTRLPTLAVLPFQNLSGDREQEYFVDGIVDDIIGALSRFRSFAVVARSSSFAYRGRSVDVRQMASELGVRYVVEGSVRRSGNRLRLVAQLDDASDGANLWSQTFDGVVDEVFEFQDRITGSVASALEPRIQRAEIERARRERPGSIAAYDLYLQAIARIYTFRPDANAEAIALLDKALELQPENGVFLGVTCWTLEHRSTMAWPPYGTNDRARCMELARAAVQRAGDDPAVLAHCGLAMQIIGKEYERGLSVAERAVELNPNDAVALINSGIAHLVGGSLDEALTRLSHAIEIDPNGAYEPMGAIGNVLCCLGRYDEALQWAKRSAAIHANYVPTHWILVAANVYLGRLEAAREALSALLEIAPGTSISRFLDGPRAAEEWRNDVLIDAFRLAGMPEG
jgi:TolB-like protein